MKSSTLYYLTVFLFVVPFSTVGQKGKLSFEFSFSQQYWKMETLNDYLNDSNNPEMTLFIESPYLKDGFKFQGKLTYQLCKLINFGVYANYQTAQISIERNYEVYDPIEGTYTDYSYDFNLQPETKSVGINLGVLYNEIFNFDKKSTFFSRVTINNDFKLGVAKSAIIGQQIMKNPFTSVFPQIYGLSNHFVGDLSLTMGYTFLKKPFFSNFGLTIGYQFYKSGIIRDPADQSIDLSNGTSANLDFSGLYFGINLCFGK